MKRGNAGSGERIGAAEAARRLAEPPPVDPAELAEACGSGIDMGYLHSYTRFVQAGRGEISREEYLAGLRRQANAELRQTIWTGRFRWRR